ncbi:MAG: FtsQ-type POTRA domain-containing protein, partial [Clostridiales bacterium]|nr:FtsQ-type POTRA domain-containing protein [Clostridiales bacterium]
EQEILQEVGLEYDAHLMSGVSGNIFDIIRLDYGKTEARIKKENPYIEDIRITIKLPSTVEIKIKERSKVCYVRTPDGYAALDRDGIVLELSSFDSNKTVQPVICGLNITSAELGKHIKISNMNDYKKSIIIIGAMLAADNASVGGDYSMFENTSEVRILPSGYIFLTIYSPSGNLIQIKLDSLDSISDDMAWLLYLFNSDRLDKVSVDGVLDMTDDDPIFREY